MRSFWLVSVALLVSLLAGCSDGGGSSVPTAPAGSDGGDENASSQTTVDSSAPTEQTEDLADESITLEDDVRVENDTPKVTITDFGFGQDEYTAQAMVIVTTDSEAAVGEFVTVSTNFLNADGQIIATEEQVEVFSWVGQELVLPVWLFQDDPNVEVASIEPHAALSNYGMRAASAAPLPVLESSEIVEQSYGGYTVSFGFTNETDDDLNDLRVGVVCYNSDAEIIGGTDTYPSLSPAGGTIRIDADPTVSEKPDSCKAFMNYGDF